MLQAYALQRYLQLQGRKADLLYIKRDVHKKSERYLNLRLSESPLERVLQKVVALCHCQDGERKHERFATFRKEHLCVGDYCDTDEKLQAQVEKYELFLNGGDQIWNPYHKSFSYHYMFDFLPDDIYRAAYGSSFGLKSIDDADICRAMARLLAKYAAVSVRDSSGVDILETMGVPATYVLDSVFLLSQEEWKTFVGRRPYKERYCLIYALSEYSKEEERRIRSFAKERHMRLVVMPENRRNRTNLFRKAFDASPEDFINLIYHADYVFTNSFHGMAFSILFQKQFALLQSTSAEAKDKYVRLTDLLSVLQIGKRTVSEREETIDYNAVQQRLTHYRKRSLDYLDRIILK